MSKQQRFISGRRRIVWASLLVAVCSAGTPGDIGGCGQPVEDLDPSVFFSTKKQIDCDSCLDCGVSSRACDAACDDRLAPERRFPDGCFPLVHDGAVCLRALLHASCADYERFVSDTAPQTPSECNFCPPELAP